MFHAMYSSLKSKIQNQNPNTWEFQVTKAQRKTREFRCGRNERFASVAGRKKERKKESNEAMKNRKQESRQASRRFSQAL
jgi:hypothetical protein